MAPLWLGCMAAASYGHATFFLLAQLHAGELRVAAVPASGVPGHRSLTAVMADLATVTADLAAANARCMRDCPALRVRRVSLAGRLDALNAEADDVWRLQAIDDRNAARRETLRDDPVTTRLAVLFAMPSGHVDLFAGRAFASVLEGVSCLLWWITLIPRESEPPVTDRHEALPTVTAVADTDIAKPETDVTQLVRDIEAGLVHPTVPDIRRHLRCSQRKAVALRRQIVASSL